MAAEIGIPFTIFTVMLYLLVIADVVNIVLALKKDKDARENYCSFGINWTKIIVSMLFAVLLLAILISGGFESAYVITIESILTGLLIITGVTNIVLKIKFGKAK